MNWKRIAGGGLVAGLVLNLGELALEPLMGPHMEAFFARLGLQAPGEAAMLLVAPTSFVGGTVAVWLYAALRPHYAAKWVAVVVVAATVWGLSCLLPNVVLYAFGVFTPTLFWLASICPLITTTAATFAGAWVYGEAPAGVAMAARSVA